MVWIRRRIDEEKEEEENEQKDEEEDDEQEHANDFGYSKVEISHHSFLPSFHACFIA